SHASSLIYYNIYNYIINPYEFDKDIFI
ncbi:hypothetical protein, partial [Plasmodium yoelii yoelii]